MTAPALLPGSTIGIVGGGQLGRMLASVAHRMGYRVAVLTGGDADTPAGRIAEVEISAPFDDPKARAAFFAEVDVMTWEFENVDPGLADAAEAEGVPVRPSGSIIATAQDRAREKAALEAAGVEVAPWRAAASLAELEAAIDALGLPVIVKTARDGYDGKGQVRVTDAADAAEAWTRLGGVRAVVESVVPFDIELSVVIARGIDGSMVDHGVMHNDHVDHILDTTVVPAPIPADRRAEAQTVARRIAEAWDLVGVLCIELFDDGHSLIVNEVAPRPHNSGHCTIEAAPASQFEQQLRAVCALPLGDGACRPAAMAQLLGDIWTDREPAWEAALADPATQLHLYGKGEARPGRKMGHLTCVGDSPEYALQRVIDVRVALSGG